MKRLILGCALVLTAIASSVAQQLSPVRVATVTGGKHDLKDVIVSIPMAGVKADFGTLFAVTEPGGGPALASQHLVSGRLGLSDGKTELLVLIPKLKAEQRKTLEVRTFLPPPGIPPSPKLFWTWHADGKVELRHSDAEERRIASWTHFKFDPNAVPKAQVLANPTIKPYHHVYDFSGKTLLTNGPDGKYPYHRGIFYGFNQISYQGKKADVWHCRNGESQRAENKGLFGDEGLFRLFGMYRLNVGWHGQDGAKFVDEVRELAFYPLAGGLLVDFRSRLKTDIADGVKLDGDPQHAGFHFRANAAVEAVAKQTYFLRPDGKGKAGEERNWEPKTKKGPVNLPWNAMCFELDGKRRTVVYLDHPDNPKEARQSERTYGRIGTYFEFMLKPDKPLFVRYRLWIQDGEMTVEQCEALSQAFVEPVKVEVK